MPEYLAPGVYVEEVSFRSKSIEGVATSTTGFVGLARTGPVRYADGDLDVPTTSEPRLVTSFTEFERVYGGLEPLAVPSDTDARVPYLPHAARMFFMNGGQRLYVSRVFKARESDAGVASNQLTVAGTTATWRARWPGAFGNVWIDVKVVRTRNLAFKDTAPATNFGVQARGVRPGAIVEIIPSSATKIPSGNDTLGTVGKVAEISVEATTGKQLFNVGGTAITPNDDDVIQLVQLQVDVRVDRERRDTTVELATHPDQKRYIGTILGVDNPEDEDSVVWLDWDPTKATEDDAAAKLMIALQAASGQRLSKGNDGGIPSASGDFDTFEGTAADLDDATKKATGIFALDEIDDIAIVAVPDAADMADDDTRFTIHQALIQHCETERYRFAVLDGPPSASMNRIRDYRGRFDTTYAALYHPWIEILDPTTNPNQGAPQARMDVPPTGAVAGIYARSDIQRGVHKAPANEVVLGLTKFEININKARQDVLNPEGINALRFFEGRGNRVWGARTASSDPEWRYVNVRRLFIYLEHSIDKGTQWAVFEPNNERLWANVRTTVEDFLLTLWRNGALLGSKPEEAYFVRCDRTTMTQNDLDNGRLIVLVGVAPVKPAEFVIFRIGQWTADAQTT